MSIVVHYPPETQFTSIWRKICIAWQLIAVKHCCTCLYIYVINPNVPLFFFEYFAGLTLFLSFMEFHMRWGTSDPRGRFLFMVIQLQIFFLRYGHFMERDWVLMFFISPFVIHLLGVINTIQLHFNAMGTLALFSADAVIIITVFVYFYRPSPINVRIVPAPRGHHNTRSADVVVLALTEANQILKMIDRSLCFFTPRYFDVFTIKVFPAFPTAIVDKILRYTHPVEMKTLSIWTVASRSSVIAYWEKQSVVLQFSLNQYLNLLRWARLHAVETLECTCWRFYLGVATMSCELCHRYTDLMPRVEANTSNVPLK